jgi:hypothetical protein
MSKRLIFRRLEGLALNGTNELIGTDPTALAPALDKLFAGHWKKGNIPEKWDGQTGGGLWRCWSGC